MSDPRIIPAGEARRLLGDATKGPWEPFLDTWEEYGPDGEIVAEYEQSGVIGGEDGILDTRPRLSLMDAPNHWEGSGEHDNRANTQLAAAAPDLAYTVIHQDGVITNIFEEVEDHHHDLLRVEQERDQLSAQIHRVWEVLDQAAKDEGHQADSLSSEYHKGRHDAYSTAAKFIRGAFGDTDE